MIFWICIATLEKMGKWILLCRGCKEKWFCVYYGPSRPLVPGEKARKLGSEDAIRLGMQKTEEKDNHEGTLVE
jgi:hypothetical protein